MNWWNQLDTVVGKVLPWSQPHLYDEDHPHEEDESTFHGPVGGLDDDDDDDIDEDFYQQEFIQQNDDEDDINNHHQLTVRDDTKNESTASRREGATQNASQESAGIDSRNRTLTRRQPSGEYDPRSATSTAATQSILSGNTLEEGGFKRPGSLQRRARSHPSAHQGPNHPTHWPDGGNNRIHIHSQNPLSNNKGPPGHEVLSSPPPTQSTTTAATPAIRPSRNQDDDDDDDNNDDRDHLPMLSPPLETPQAEPQGRKEIPPSFEDRASIGEPETRNACAVKAGPSHMIPATITITTTSTPQKVKGTEQEMSSTAELVDDLSDILSRVAATPSTAPVAMTASASLVEESTTVEESNPIAIAPSPSSAAPSSLVFVDNTATTSKLTSRPGSLQKRPRRLGPATSTQVAAGAAAYQSLSLPRLEQEEPTPKTKGGKGPDHENRHNHPPSRDPPKKGRLQDSTEHKKGLPVLDDSESDSRLVAPAIGPENAEIRMEARSSGADLGIGSRTGADRPIATKQSSASSSVFGIHRPRLPDDSWSDQDEDQGELSFVGRTDPNRFNLEASPQRSPPHRSLQRQTSIPDQIAFDESEFSAPAPQTSWIDCSDTQFHTSMNCYGVVHVRVLRAQRLPCSIGSNVQAVVSLEPWQGKVRTESARSFFGPTEENGVCVRWDEDETPALAMVHAYSSEESPVPSIKVNLVFIPLGMFEFTMCTICLPCHVLLKSPLTPFRQWFESSSEGHGRNLGHPLVLIEAMFEPAGLASSQAKSEVSDDATSSKDDVRSRHNRSKPTAVADDSSHSDYFSVYTRRGVQIDQSKQHLLRLHKFWTPATCSVCHKNLMSVLRQVKSFHCERCQVDCCSDCRLQVDVQLPCGSDEARRAVEDSIQHKLRLERILSVVAPIEKSSKKHESNTNVKNDARDAETANSDNALAESRKGIGVLELDIVRAHILLDPLPPEADVQQIVETDLSHLRGGDYYCRVSWTRSDETVRTKTIQSSAKPLFSGEEMKFVVPNYGTEYRIEVVEASSEAVVGYSLVTIQAVLQQQLERFMSKQALPILSFFTPSWKFADKYPYVLELRSGLKSGRGNDFFPATKAGTSQTSKRPGSVVGCLEVRLVFREDFASLYGKDPYECPPRPVEEFDMNIIQLHLARIASIIEDIKRGVAIFAFVVSWKNPMLTAASLFFFARMTIMFDLSYVGGLPVIFLVFFMLYGFGLRALGITRTAYLRKEIDSRRKTEMVTVDYALHRPVGRVDVSVDRGRNIVSPELGLPGQVACRVLWDPTRLMDEKEKAHFVKIDRAAKTSHDIGSTASQYSSKPAWDHMIESEEVRRMKMLIPPESGKMDATHASEPTRSLTFPVLQPLVELGPGELSLDSWTNSKAAVVFQVVLSDPISLMPGSEYVLGEVSVPFSRLARSGSITGWFDIQGVGTQIDASSSVATAPQIFLRLTWIPPQKNDSSPDPKEREVSIVVQEELLRASAIKSNNKGGFVGNSVGALNTMRNIRSMLQDIQNTLGSVLDVVESIRNAFVFTDPFKSSLLLLCLVVISLFLMIIPTKWIVLVLGLALYGATFSNRFGRSLRRFLSASAETNRETITLSRPSQGSSPYLTWLINALRGVPTEEDIRRTYFWESRRIAAQEMEAFISQKRTSRLTRLWGASWFSRITLIRTSPDGSLVRQYLFAIVQGHRLLWWGSVEDFDSGEAHIGQIFFSGHAGLASPSPSELRAIAKDELPRVTSVFGRGLDRQDKVTILTPSVAVKEELERAVESAIATKID